ncbi:ABC transporter ATP-binding protein [Roseovarius autotrophicus]|uniref:ABC transporter ATP-binding protein n=1 Tax=Roseovarius autotrophicus TaxID=2824121 RepID=UPI001FFC6D14|nr:ABC transporter ATP-binding protein [Roseovarius autotrophicus]
MQALREVSLEVPAGQIVGIVGESGCGKSTLIGALLHLLPENATRTGGSIRLADEEIATASPRRLRDLRGQDMSVVFQDPMTSLNPVISIGRQMRDIQYRDRIGHAEKNDRAAAMLARVGMPDPKGKLSAYPHELSGGMRQRVAIAMAAMMMPKLLIADEPTTALDATLEIQIIELLKEIQKEIGCAILFISHHLGVIAELCDRVVVMYAGEVVEEGAVEEVFLRPAHPYTQKLIECDPGRLKRKVASLPSIPGSLPDLTNPPAGCIFRARCPYATDICIERPPRVTLTPPHWAACHHAQEVHG